MRHQGDPTGGGKRQSKRFIALVLFVALASAGCSQRELPLSALSSHRTYADFIRLGRLVGFDYQPAATPLDLAREVELVVTGTIVGVQPGQSYAPTPEAEAAIATSVLQVKVEQIVAGSPSLVADGNVYIEVPHPAYVGSGAPGADGEGEPDEVTPFDHEAFAATVPQSFGVFFLYDRTNEPYWDTILDAGMGRPTGAPLMTAAVQGFLLERDDGSLVSVMEPLAAMPVAWHNLSSIQGVVALLTQ